MNGGLQNLINIQTITYEQQTISLVSEQFSHHKHLQIVQAVDIPLYPQVSPEVKFSHSLNNFFSIEEKIGS